MKLWLLTRITDDKSPIYDCADGFVIRAETETAARRYATEQAGDEGKLVWAWSLKSLCVELTAEGEPGVVLQDFHAG